MKGSISSRGSQGESSSWLFSQRLQRCVPEMERAGEKQPVAACVRSRARVLCREEASVRPSVRPTGILLPLCLQTPPGAAEAWGGLCQEQDSHSGWNLDQPPPAEDAALTRNTRKESSDFGAYLMARTETRKPLI